MKTLLTVMTVLLLSSTMSNAQNNKTSDTQIIKNQDTGQVIIKIEGQTVGIFDRDGLTVVGNIKYDGAMIDIGHEKIIESNSRSGSTQKEEENINEK